MQIRFKLLGFVAGALVGAAFSVMFYMNNFTHNNKYNFAPTVVQEKIKVLSKGGDDVHEFKPNPKTQSLALIVESWRRIGKYDNAFKTITSTKSPEQKDYLLKFFADRLLTEFSTDKNTPETYITENGGESKVREVLPPFHQAVDAIDNATIKIPLLLRLHAVKGMLEKKIVESKDSDEFINKASMLAEKLPDETPQDSTFESKSHDEGFDLRLGFILTGLLGLLGFILASIFDPALKSLGVIIGMSFAKHFGQAEFLEILKKYDSQLIAHAVEKLKPKSTTKES